MKSQICLSVFVLLFKLDEYLVYGHSHGHGHTGGHGHTSENTYTNHVANSNSNSKRITRIGVSVFTTYSLYKNFESSLQRRDFNTSVYYNLDNIVYILDKDKYLYRIVCFLYKKSELSDTNMSIIIDVRNISIIKTRDYSIFSRDNYTYYCNIVKEYNTSNTTSNTSTSYNIYYNTSNFATLIVLVITFMCCITCSQSRTSLL